MKALHQQVQLRIKLDEDNVRFYWIAADGLPRTMPLGSPPPEPSPDFYIV